MMGTLAAVLAKKGIKTPEDLYWAEVEGDIDNVNGVLKITQIRVNYHVTAEDEKADGAPGKPLLRILPPAPLPKA